MADVNLNFEEIKKARDAMAPMVEMIENFLAMTEDIDYMDRCEHLEEEALRATLEFYAEERNHDDPSAIVGSKVGNDRGKIARDSLRDIDARLR